MPKLIFPTLIESGEPMATFGKNTLVVLSYTPWVYLHGKLDSESSTLGGWDKFKWYSTPPESDGMNAVWHSQTKGLWKPQHTFGKPNLAKEEPKLQAWWLPKMI